MIVNMLPILYTLEKLSGTPALPSHAYYGRGQVSLVWTFTAGNTRFQSETLVDLCPRRPITYRYLGLDGPKSKEGWITLHRTHISSSIITLQDPSYEIDYLTKAVSLIGISFDEPPAPGYM